MSDTQHQINVRVDTRYLPKQSVPKQNRLAFAYTVAIENQDGAPAQLPSRHWIVTDGDGHIQEVRGADVAGEQPSVVPGMQYIYTSGMMLVTRVGSTRGSYQMLGSDEIAFDVAIPAFRLVVSGVLY